MKEFELEPGEHVVKESRKHWFLFLEELLPYAIIAIIPFALPKFLVLAPSLAPYTALFDYQAPLARAVLGAWLLITWTGAWGACTRYFLNAWVLTNKRLVDIDQRSYFHREVSSLNLSRVQDVTTNISGILASMLGLGDISVQTAGASDEFHMRGIPRPEQMRDLILKYAATTEPKNTGI
ncbi:MAG: PH domain-containing protein [Candidatus Kaiserbacteria bacterium]|nr:PH domain-containing protein [Candidatus Kaiserbacteria bacterium]